MWGSDQMVWPRAIDVAIEALESAPFLSAEQKRDIFYNNAARFLRLSEEEIAKHHGRSPCPGGRTATSKPTEEPEITPARPKRHLS